MRRVLPAVFVALLVSAPVAGAPADIALPDGWRPLPEVALTVDAVMDLPTHTRAFGDPARGCYAAEILARVDGAEASWVAIDKGLGSGLVSGGGKVISRAAGAGQSEREVILGPLRGRIRARYEKNKAPKTGDGIDVAITGCLFSARAPAHCQATCAAVLTNLEKR